MVDMTICTSDDVKNEGTISDESLDDFIEYRIPVSIENVVNIELELFEETDLYSIMGDPIQKLNLKRAVIYDVLAWLENEGKIEGNSFDITSVSDSQVSLSYAKRTSGKYTSPSSYSELSKYYLNKLKGNYNKPPVGGVPSGSFYKQSENYEG
jgi:hypothetical protein